MAELASLTPDIPSVRPLRSASRERDDTEKENEDGMEHLDEEVSQYLIS